MRPKPGPRPAVECLSGWRRRCSATLAANVRAQFDQFRGLASTGTVEWFRFVIRRPSPYGAKKLRCLVSEGPAASRPLISAGVGPEAGNTAQDPRKTSPRAKFDSSRRWRRIRGLGRMARVRGAPAQQRQVGVAWLCLRFRFGVLSRGLVRPLRLDRTQRTVASRPCSLTTRPICVLARSRTDRRDRRGFL